MEATTTVTNNDIAAEVYRLHEEEYPRGCPNMCGQCANRWVKVVDTRYSQKTGGCNVWYHAGIRKYAVTRGLGQEARWPTIEEFCYTSKKAALVRTRHLLGWKVGGR